MTSKESEYYDLIGKWLISEKGCQKNEYSKGYVKEVELVKNSIVDVFGLKYTFYDGNTSRNSFTFSGYAVEMKISPSDVVKDIDKITTEYLPKIPEITPERLRNCLHTINFYIAFIGSITPPDILTRCRNAGVGILRIYESGNDELLVTEDLEPKEQILTGISNAEQTSSGIFEEAIRDTRYVNAVIENPCKLFDECLRPKLTQYRKQRALERAYNYCTAEEGKEALDCIFSEVITNNPAFIAEGGGKQDQEDRIAIISRKEGEQVLQIEMKRNYFYIGTMNGKRFRVTSKNQIFDFSEGSGRPYSGDLQKLIETEIKPKVKL